MKTELKQGIKGNGQNDYQVIVYRADGLIDFIHHFDTEGEAKNWIKWAY